jgi:L-serine dehydratase
MISVFDLFSIGIGPSSSHTVGPMRAAKRFAESIVPLFPSIKAIKTTLYGSLAYTGKGHGTDIAIFMGLQGESPEDIDPQLVSKKMEKIRQDKSLLLLGKIPLFFEEKEHLIYEKMHTKPFHTNAILFEVLDKDNHSIYEKTYYSVGGGFVVEEGSSGKNEEIIKIDFPFNTADELFTHCKNKQATVAEIVRANERSLRTEQEIKEGLYKRYHVMSQSIEKGCINEGILPGGLKVRRRAPKLFKQLKEQGLHEDKSKYPAELLEWVSLWALAVNEENAAGGRVVTAPTNGAAGVIPAVMRYAEKYIPDKKEDWVETFLLTAGAIAILYKKGASISAAEMGCMGEVGVACSMAAGALTAIMGGSIYEVENAAEIGMEHHLGMTCDPVGGLVQIPCIERNTMGAIKAINASLLAIRAEGEHKVSLDQVIATMKQTGNDMKSIYKETSLGGLAVNVPEC